MNKVKATSRTPNSVRRANAAQRAGRNREKLLRTGAKMFVESGMAKVSVEQLIVEADISRATFYGFFENKNELAAAILMPVFDSGITAMEEICELPPRKAAEELITFYLRLFRDHRNAVLLVSIFDGFVYSYIKDQHDAYQMRLEQVLRVIESENLLRNNSVELTLALLAKTAIPLLRVYKDSANLDQIYRESMHALLLKS